MKATLILTGGPVVSVDAANTVHEALAVRGDKILAVGTRDRVMELRGPGTEVIDLRGRTAVPGLIESHCHMLSFGTNQLGVNLKYPNVRSIEDVKVALKKKTAVTPPGSWIRGWGYDHSKLTEKRHPNRWDLDQASTEHPVYLSRTCGHIGVANSLALKMAGVTNETSDPPGGRFERIDGRLSGVAFEAAQGLLRGSDRFGCDELRKAAKACNDYWLKNGFTSSSDAGSFASHPDVLMDAIDAGDMKLRIYMTVTVHDLESEEKWLQRLQSGLREKLEQRGVKVGPLKVFIDGSSSGPTAATREPYASDPEDSGMLYLDQQHLDEIVERGHVAGYQVTCHAVGDKAIEMMLSAIEKAMTRHPRPDPRHRIEHCAICPPDLQDRIRR
jgi:hypothetical protein